MGIHPTAIVDPRAQIDPAADIGPYVVIDGPVVVGAGTRVMAHATLLGETTIGRDNVIHPGATIGDDPQDLSFQGQRTFLRIGDRNVIREHVEIHRASKEDGATEVGDDNFLMSHAHIAHDCRVGNRVILASGALLAGHVTVGDRAFLSGNCVVHQFVRIGRLAIMRGLSRAGLDVPPFCIMDGTHTVRGINRVGLRRAGFDGERIRAVHRAFVQLFRGRRNLGMAVAEVASLPHTSDVDELLDFIRSSKRGVCRGVRTSDGEAVDED